MDQNVRRFTGVGAVRPEEITSDTQPPRLRTPITAEPLSKPPFDLHVSRDPGGRHLRLVPDPAATHPPTQIPTEEEHDGDEGEDRCAATTEIEQGTRPRTDGELEEKEDEKDLPRQVAAVVPVPRL